MIAERAAELAWKRFVAREARPWTDLDTFPRLSPAEQRREIAARLMAQIRYFGSREDALPEWKDAAQCATVDDLWREWPKLPILSKQMIKEHFPAGEMVRRFGLDGQVKASGGSTGEPTQFFHDRLMLKTAIAGNVYTRLRMGWRPGMPTVVVWGSERDIGRQAGNWRTRLHSSLLREYLVDGYKLTQATVDRVVGLLRKHRPAALYGFTSMLEFVARGVIDRGLSVSPGTVRAAWNGGEMLFPEQAEVFQRAFAAPLLNRYGGRELSTIACQFEQGGGLNILRPWIFVELVDESGKPASAGQVGRIVLTSTVCRGTPFLRYDLEDFGTFEASCENESGIAAISELHGRRAGLVRLPGGRTINNIYWNHLFKEFAEVRQFQVLVRPAEIRISLVGAGLTEVREKELRSMLNPVLGGIPLTIRWVSEIPRTAQGKLLQVVQENGSAQ